MRTLQGFRTVFGAARGQDAEVRRIAKLSTSQLWALSEITARNGMTVNGLAERMALHQTTASNLVNALVERKLIRRARDADDQRIVHLHVTGEGRRVLRRAPGPHCGLLADALKRMSPDQLTALDRALRGLVAVMEGVAPNASGETLFGE
jgi:DNA-binding MarR family transcriptional regulator